MAVGEERWYVVCDDYFVGPYLLEKQAELRAAQLNHDGRCSLHHVAVLSVLDDDGVRWLPDGRRVN